MNYAIKRRHAVMVLGLLLMGRLRSCLILFHPSSRLFVEILCLWRPEPSRKGVLRESNAGRRYHQDARSEAKRYNRSKIAHWIVVQARVKSWCDCVRGRVDEGRV